MSGMLRKSDLHYTKKSTYRKEVLGRQLHHSQTACREKQKNAAYMAGYIVIAHYAHMGHIYPWAI